MRLYLVRHGQTAWNELRRAQGHTDIPLDAEGLRQADALGEAFRNIPLARIICSDLSRARQTAEAIASVTGTPLETRLDLRERGFGEWEGSDFSKVHDWIESAAQERGEHILAVRPPGGESYADVWDRLATVQADLEASTGSVAIVSHGGAGSLLLARLLKGTLETSRGFRLSNTGVTELERRADGYFVMLRYNDVSHTLALRPLISGLDAAAR